MKRLLVTGSRHWTDADRIMSALDEAVDVLWPNEDPNHDPIILVHGDARGADRLAASIWTSRWSMDTEAHPADWSAPCVESCAPGHRRRPTAARDTYCPAVGHRRNAEMVALGADLCLAFPLGVSRGTHGCMKLARAAGIPVRRIGAAT